MSMSDYLENKLLNHVMNNTAYTPAATVYVALFTADPTDAFTTANEVSAVVNDTAYARQTTASTTASGTSGAITNSAPVTFPAVVYGSGAAPYNVTHFGICDAATAGNLLFSGAIGATISRTVGVTLTIGTGQLTTTMA